MAQVFLKEGESGESLLNRFRAAVVRSGVLKELRDRRFFRSESEKKKLAAARAARRQRRKTALAK